MTTGFFQKVRRDESGTFIVFMALSLLGLFGMAALSIDIGHVYQQKRDMQSASDAAALAGVALLTNSPPVKANIIQTAQAIALSNGLTIAEITAATSDDGTIEVGTWNTNNTPPFTANTPSGTWNAVRVPAKRSVGLFFGALTVGPGNGLSAMSPAVRTVAALTGVGSVTNAVDFGIGLSDLGTATFGSIIDLNSTGSGDTGALDLHGETKQPGDWVSAFVNGYSGVVSVGDTDDTTRPGIPSKVSGAFDTRIQNGDDIVVMPIIADPTQSNKPVQILGFVEVQLISAGGGVGNWSGQVKFLQMALGTSGGGIGLAPFDQARVLVQ